MLLIVGICCVARRRQKEVDRHEKGDIPLEEYYDTDAGEKGENAEVNPSTGEYTCTATKSPLSDENEKTSDTQPAMYSEHGERRHSAEYAAVAVVHHSATHTPPLSSQDYTTIPDKEPAEGLYDTADIAPQKEDTLATHPAADYASIVEPAQEGTDDTEQPPPVPAFDPEILYTQPDKTSKAKDEGYETIPETPGPAAVGEYEPVGMPHTRNEKQTKVTILTTAHRETPDFGYDTVPDTSGPVAEAGYEAVDIPRTNTAAAAQATQAKNLSHKPPTYRPGQPMDSVYETVSDSTLPPPVDVSPGYEAVHYPPNPYPAQGRTLPAQPKGSDANTLYAEPEGTVEQRVAKDKVDGYAKVSDKTSKGAKTEQPADGLYSTPDMSQKNGRTGTQRLVVGEGHKDTPLGTPTAADHLYATPDMSKKQKRQSHMSNNSPPEDQQSR